MKLNRFFNNHVLRNPDDGEGNQLPGGGQEGGEKETPTLESLQEQLNAVLAENEKIKTKNAELLNETKTAKQKARERQEAADKAAEEAARKNGDIEALDNSWKEKNSKLQEKIEQYQSNARKTHIESVAQKIAEDAFGKNAAVGIHHVRERIGIEENENGEFKTIIKDKDGNRSALTIDELSSEFKNNEMFESIVIGTKANGGGANGGNKGTTTKPGSAEARKARTRAALQKAN